MSLRKNMPVIVATALLACVNGCSLMSFKSLDKPLSTRDMNARVLAREYSAGFRAAVVKSADDIIEAGESQDVTENALRWKMSGTTESQRAALQLSPLMGVLDTWALALQMKAFFSAGGAGSDLFGTHQAAAAAVAGELAVSADTLARRVLPAKEFDQYQQFVAAYVRDYPLADLRFARVSIVGLWSQRSGTEVRVVDTLGTIPEATADLAQRIQIYGETGPSQAIWQTQLALLDSGYSGADVRAARERLDRRLDALSKVADSTPEMVREAVGEVRESTKEVIDRLNVAMISLIEALHVERVELTESVRVEREALSGVVDLQRQAIAVDAAKIADQVVKSSGEQLRRMARELLLLLILAGAVILTLPFAAGYFVGRARSQSARTPGAGSH